MPHAGLAAVLLGVTLITVLHFVFRTNWQQSAHQYYEENYNSYSKRENCISDGENCPICLCALDDERNGRRYMLRDCKHQFHSRCINGWKTHGENPSCPVCRTPIS